MVSPSTPKKRKATPSSPPPPPIRTLTPDQLKVCLAKARAAGKQICSLSLKEKEGVETRKRLEEFDFGDVLEITSVELANGKDGSFGIGQCSLTRKKGQKDTETVMIPTRLVESDEVRVPLVMVCLGKKTSTNGMEYYNTKTCPCDTIKDMKKAASLREQDPAKLEELVTAKSMSYFPKRSVLLLKTMYSRETKREGFPAQTWVATYELLVDNENPNEEGEVYVPERVVEACSSKIPLSVCYLRLQLSANGHKWHYIRLANSDGDYRSLGTRNTDADKQTMEEWDSTEDLIAAM